MPHDVAKAKIDALIQRIELAEKIPGGGIRLDPDATEALRQALELMRDAAFPELLAREPNLPAETEELLTEATEALAPFAKISELRELERDVASGSFPLYMSLRNGNQQQAVIREGCPYVSDFRRAHRVHAELTKAGSAG